MDFKDINFLSIYPMKAKGIDPEDIPWEDPNYIWEEKYDGDRRLLWITKEKNYNTSRNKSKKTNLPTDKTDNTPHLRDLPLHHLDDTILDGEFIHRKGFEYVRKIMGALPEKAAETQKEHGEIEYVLYDILKYKGEWLTDKPLYERKKILYRLYNQNVDIINEHMVLANLLVGSKEELQNKLAEIIQNGGEGMIAKHKGSTYRVSTEKCMTCLKKDWVKIKKEYEGDFVIMGFEEPTKEFEGKTDLDKWPYWEDSQPVTKNHAMGWFGGILYGDYQGGVLTEVGTLSSSSFNEKMRAEISKEKESYIGKVMQISAMERHPKDKTIRHATFMRFRDDKEPEECIYEHQKG